MRHIMATVALSLVFAYIAPAASEQAEKLNVLLIVSDDLNNALDCYGQVGGFNLGKATRNGTGALIEEETGNEKYGERKRCRFGDEKTSARQFLTTFSILRFPCWSAQRTLLLIPFFRPHLEPGVGVSAAL